jgi:vacuolar-type H+-ATPase subunit I/STV1
MPAPAREYDLLLKNASQVAFMKILSAFIAISLIGVSFNARAAEPPRDLEREQQQIAALAKEVQAQQATIADNQKKIDEKLAAIAEALRQAKIYSTRAR